MTLNYQFEQQSNESKYKPKLVIDCRYNTNNMGEKQQ